MKRVVCVWFPNWPIQRWSVEHRDEPTRPLLVATERGQQSVVACSLDLEREGVLPGMRVADARGLCGDGLRLVSHDPVADAGGLEAIARWCGRYSPVVGVDPPDGLRLDATGCDHLHGGERSMLHEMHRGLAEHGFRSRLAMADTIGLAWAVCRFGRSATAVVPTSAGLAAIRQLPCEALRLDPAAVTMLRELGVTTVERLERLPRSTLPARFGTAITRRLDEARGELPEIVEPIPPLERLHEFRDFEPSLPDREHVERAVATLLESLLDRLRARREGVVRLAIRLTLESGEPVEATIGCVHGIDSAERLLRLVGLRLERAELAGGVERVEVEVTDRAPLGWRRTTLFGDDEETDREFVDLVERLSQRLGERSVLRPRLVADAQPERAFRFTPALRPVGRTTVGRTTVGRTTEVTPTPGRPLSLLPEPVSLTTESGDGPPPRFTWRGRTHVVGRWWGPERIATGWWRGRHVRRDYFRVEAETGHRFWLFRCGSTGEWFLHGTFD